MRKSALATAEARRGGGRRIGRAQHLAVDLKQYAEDCVQLRRSRKTRGLVAFTLNGNTNAGAVGPPCTGTKVPVTSASSSSCTTTRAEGGSIRAQPADGTASAHAVVTGRSQHATLARTTKLLTVANASAGHSVALPVPGAPTSAIVGASPVAKWMEHTRSWLARGSLMRSFEAPCRLSILHREPHGGCRVQCDVCHD